jgi:hypothetical protein
VAGAVLGALTPSVTIATALATLGPALDGVARMCRKRLLVALGLCCLAAPAGAQPADAPGPVGGAAASLPELRLPGAEQIRAPLPRTVKTAAALAGLGTIGRRLAVGPAACCGASASN